MSQSYTTRNQVRAARDDFYAVYDALSSDDQLSGSAWDAYMAVNDALNANRDGQITNSVAAHAIQQQIDRLQGRW